MNPALEFRNPSVYSKSGVTTNMKTAVSGFLETSGYQMRLLFLKVSASFVDHDYHY